MFLTNLHVKYSGARYVMLDIRSSGIPINIVLLYGYVCLCPILKCVADMKEYCQ